MNFFACLLSLKSPCVRCVDRFSINRSSDSTPLTASLTFSFLGGGLYYTNGQPNVKLY
jgi:hypothetical protein